MVVCAFVAFLIGFKHRKKFLELRFLFFYATASILQIFSLYYAILFHPKSTIKLERITVNLFILIEFAILFHFFNSVILFLPLKKILRAIFMGFFIYVTLLWSLTNSFYDFPARLYLPESLCILTFCFLYLLQLFILPPRLHITSNPAFWVTVGCLFYFSCTIPLFFLDALIPLPLYHQFYSINYLAYALLFVFIAKSFFCKPRSLITTYETNDL